MSAPSTPARERSRSSTLENVSTLAAALPSTLGRPRNSLPAIGAARRNAALSPFPPWQTPLAPVHPADGHARRDDSASGSRSANGVRAAARRLSTLPSSVADRDPYTSPPFARRRARRDYRRSARRLAGSASCALSVGDAVGAARALVRGAQIEMAAALMLSVPRGAPARSRRASRVTMRTRDGVARMGRAFRSAVDVAD